MKDILVEFTNHGAVIHKKESVISSKKDLPNCILNPDLSAVSGVSPSYWMLTEFGKIIKCSEEEIKKRNEHHSSVVSDVLNKKNELSVINDVAEELKLSIKDQEIVLNGKINDLSMSLDFVIKCFRDNKDLNKEKFKELEKQLYMYKIALIVSVIIALIGVFK